ncbi:endonuclease/exonuclease/phosphatase family protein [Arthrobacter sp. H20]|uniref:endonuclease/exonuclease/phosphatase family protein n=1 Tax=Arthrobacter sp. H20 TaxID=1267981 RepID=UPI0012DCD4D6|nr:endonuclease/exonuclease/phosphatase family protein [Arthrobacter sp. H20]
MTTPPAVVAEDLLRLRTALDGTVPGKEDSNLLVATWNVRAFGDLTKEWKAGPKDSPKRDFHAMACIAEIVSRFDILALQEVRRNTTALQYLLGLLGLLGPSWRWPRPHLLRVSAWSADRTQERSAGW